MIYTNTLKPLFTIKNKLFLRTRYKLLLFRNASSAPAELCVRMWPESTLFGSGLGLQNLVYLHKIPSNARSAIMALSTGTQYTSPQPQDSQPTQSVICAALPKTGPAHNQHTLVLVLCWLLNWGGVNMAVVLIVGHVGWETEGFKGPLTVEYL